ncbi:RNA polymerase sigma factor SigJ [Microbacterium ulmi]|uniref:RNA polymerase sigma factor SigJ n=1 Tax=Microbacterium ulmi TaxID=179095 RepID=A0A7Y2LXI2_9MICO|nr:RNA polymerase sigma factor SigJ [Microbacterium ulmi]NII71352.1 RNA polymerase sigma-70 factor (ECF subfamily) [Microbacterium ulmi]NNH02656.1 RNA polymerase sigma factor SigJ [Microbacterium ulmi]
MRSVAEHRGLLMSVAYRLVGSVVEAEDAVQEAFTRWYALTPAARSAIDSPAAWLVTVTTRICLDTLGSARARRERYVGEWLPEPVPADAQWTSHAAPDRGTDPADRLSLDESLNMALLVVLEAMTPAERVSFVLHDVFQYTFVEIAEIVGRSPQACRQLASSARRRVRDTRRTSVSELEHTRVVGAFKVALDSGDIAQLVELLDPRATIVGDGGGVVRAAIEPIVGAETVARYILGLSDVQPDLRFEVAVVNGRSGLVVKDATGLTLAVAAVAVAEGRIRSIWAVRNPAKLAAFRQR